MTDMPNTKAADNINCWLCDHFQRYDQSETPESCLGECRANAVSFLMAGVVNDNYAEMMFAFPLIMKAPFHWCGRFERSTESNIPPAPPTQDDCPAVDIWEEYTHWKPWRKKDISCWTCDHFQRRWEDPSEEDPEVACIGQCRRNPPPFFGHSWSFMGSEGYLFSAWWHTWAGPLYWCGEWERSRYDVPPIPTYNGEQCPKVDMERRQKIADKFRAQVTGDVMGTGKPKKAQKETKKQ